MTESFESIFAFISMVTLNDFSTAPKIKLEVVCMHVQMKMVTNFRSVDCMLKITAEYNSTSKTDDFKQQNITSISRKKREWLQMQIRRWSQFIEFVSVTQAYQEVRKWWLFYFKNLLACLPTTFSEVSFTQKVSGQNKNTNLLSMSLWTLRNVKICWRPIMVCRKNHNFNSSNKARPFTTWVRCSEGPNVRSQHKTRGEKKKKIIIVKQLKRAILHLSSKQNLRHTRSSLSIRNRKLTPYLFFFFKQYLLMFRCTFWVFYQPSRII